MRFLLRRSATVFGALLALYLVVGNIFLNVPGTPDVVNRRPDRFQMKWSGGLTWFPGYLMLWNVKSKGHVRHILWTAQAPRVRGHIAISALLLRELRVTSADAVDVVAQADYSDQEVLPLPSDPNAWTLRFDRIHTTSLRHLRFGDVDAEVEGEAAFGFIKQLHGGILEVLPSSVDLTHVRILWSGRELVRDATVKGGFAIAPHLPAQVRGIRKLALTDATLEVAGSIPPELLELDPTGNWDSSSVVGMQAGDVRANMSLRHGVLQDGGRIDVRFPTTTRVHSATKDDGPTLSARVQASSSHIVLHIPAPPAHVGAVDADLRVDDNTLESLAPPRKWAPRISGTARLDWRFTSLNWLAPLLIDKPWLALEGSGHVDAQIRLSKGELQPNSRINIADINLMATVAGFQFRGLVLAEGRLEQTQEASRAHVRLGVPHFDVAGAKAGMKALIRGEALRVDLDSAPALDAFRESLVGRLRFDRATMPDLRVLNAYIPAGTLGITDGTADISSDLALDSDGRILSGTVRLAGRKAAAALGNLHIGGDFDLNARIGGSDPRRRYYKLDGSTLQTRNVRLLDPSQGAVGDGAWANLTVRRGRLEGTKPLVVDSDVDVEFENIALLLGLFAKQHEYPKWALKIADAGVLRASSTMHIDGKTVVFDPVVAKNDHVDVKARLRFAGKEPTGDLLVRWGLLNFGLEVAGSKREFHFLRAGAWFDGQPPLEGR